MLKHATHCMRLAVATCMYWTQWARDQRSTCHVLCAIGNIEYCKPLTRPSEMHAPRSEQSKSRFKVHIMYSASRICKNVHTIVEGQVMYLIHHHHLTSQFGAVQPQLHHHHRCHHLLLLSFVAASWQPQPPWMPCAFSDWLAWSLLNGTGACSSSVWRHALHGNSPLELLAAEP